MPDMPSPMHIKPRGAPMPCRNPSYSSPDDWPALDLRLSSRADPDSAVEPAVRDILARVRTEGDAALVDYTRRIDCPDFSADMLRVDRAEIRRALDDLPRPERDILTRAADNISAFHQRQVQQSWMTTQPDGTILGQMVTPVDRAGLYVPGGQGGDTPLISSLLMNAVPAQVAGVPHIAVATPPRRDGSVNPRILAAAGLLGLDEIYAVGSAWAVAGLAYGTRTLPGVDVIAGPGNIYVTTAKRLLMGKVGIDMIAGPSEICILADATADPEQIAADMLSQAEHDPQAAALCIVADPALAEPVCAALRNQLAALPRNEIAAKSLADYGAVITVPNVETGLELVNRIAPEHFELMVAEPFLLLGKIRNAGAVFIGAQTPEPVGDYFAGPNHVLPTMGTARFSSALGVDTFVKKSSVIAASADYVREHGPAIASLARWEGLEAHARSVEQRLKPHKK